jgi:catechol 2,3-dioxygenase
MEGDRRDEGLVTAFFTGRTHHELLLIEAGRDAQPIPQNRTLGMYHIRVKIGESDEELKSPLQEFGEKNVEIVGMTDHTVAHSLYIRDPDGNDIELYIDVQPEIWREKPDAVFAPPPPLNL